MVRFKGIRPYRYDTVSYLVRTKPENSGLINALMEGYDGVALVRTRDEHEALIEFWVPVEQIREFKEIYQGLAKELELQLVKVSRTIPF